MLQDDILKILADGSAGTKGTNLMNGPLPEEPAEAIAVMVYGGSEAEYTFKTDGLSAPEVERPRFQVDCRSASQLTAWTNARLCKSLLNGKGGSINGCEYLRIRILGEPMELGEDGNLYYSVKANYEAEKVPS
jgi:hypothetical protein